MMSVRCILVLTTVPVRIRPRMETMPVKGHFLSGKNTVLVWGILQLRLAEASDIELLRPSVRSHSDGIPMYLPSIAVLGVLNPRPTSLYHLLPPRPTLVALAAFEPFLWLRKMCGCFWKARSLWTVNSVAMIAVLSNQSGWRGIAVVFRGGCCSLRSLVAPAKFSSLGSAIEKARQGPDKLSSGAELSRFPIEPMLMLVNNSAPR